LFLFSGRISFCEWPNPASTIPAAPMDKDYLILKRASTSRSSGERGDDDYDVVADGAVVGRILKAHAAPAGSPWMWTLMFGYHEDRTPTHGYAETREAAMTAFARVGGGSKRKPRACRGSRSMRNCLAS